MRLYYLSFASALLLAFIYQIGTAGLRWLWTRLQWRHRRVGRWMIPAFALLYAMPVVEEFWIAWKFERLCGSGPRWISPDAGTRSAGGSDPPEASSVVAHKIEVWTSAALEPSGSLAAVRYVRWPPWFNLDAAPLLLACDARHL